jgi:hypothetical protein
MDVWMNISDVWMDVWRYGWMDGSREIEAVVNLPRTINIHFWDAFEYFLVASI